MELRSIIRTDKMSKSRLVLMPYSTVFQNSSKTCTRAPHLYGTFDTFIFRTAQLLIRIGFLSEESRSAFKNGVNAFWKIVAIKREKTQLRCRIQRACKTL